MPFLDVSNVVLDPMFASAVSVLRRREVVTTKGRVTVSTTTFPRVVGVLTMASPNDLKRLDDQQRTLRTISFVTKFPLRATAKGYQPDLIQWFGDNFIVQLLEPYPRFGAGFYQAIATSIDSQDEPMTYGPPILGILNFTNPKNSALLGALGG